jgi:hypothetical protein
MKWKSEAVSLSLSLNFLRGTPLNVILVARLLLSPVAQALCRCEHGMFILEHCFALKPFDTVHEAVSNAGLDGEESNKTKMLMSPVSLHILL